MSPSGTHEAPQAGDLEAARLLLARLGVNPADLLTDTAGSTERPVPTVAEWIPVVTGLVSPSTARAYRSYWARAEAAWGERRLDEVTASDIRAQAEKAKATAVVRRNSRGGRSAAENFVAALRCLYRHAEDDGLIDERRNPARRVTKPRRLPSTRRALPDERLSEIIEVAAATDDDPELDTLMVRLHIETACRRGGALALRLRDLDTDQCLLFLREKAETVRWQPVSPTLMRHLETHARTRGATEPDTAVLRYARGGQLTRRRYDHLWNRVARHLPWARAQQISTHWLRHTTLTWVERHFGFATAHAYAGHTDSHDNATSTYVKADLTDIATALATLTGEDHPLAHNRRQH